MDLPILKGLYPFRLATTSFIYPAGYAANVGRLAPYLDEIELLLFESAAGSLPAPSIIAELRRLAAEQHVTYNVHWPLDIDLGAFDPAVRQRAVDALKTAMERVQPLSPTSYTLHLACNMPDRGPDAVAAWQDRTADSLARLLAQTALPGRQICIETLDYPPAWFRPLLEQFDLAVCLDVGHIIRHGYALDNIFSDFMNRTRIFHLHGVRQGKDHLALDQLDEAVQRKLAAVLSEFRGSVSLEVFSHQNLADSMHALRRMIQSAATIKPEDHD